ncbi:MAG TPA: type II toxin-antitoxin system RelE/ParE family toxin [Pyrinomonadaceae bacterium]|nr:type II toxin-antitoxin system RelE/ParE family toxin [Pyrinomonadaceae bacterium]
MNWRVVSRPDAEDDVIEIAAWYESRAQGLGHRFVEEFLAVLDQLALNPVVHCRRHPRKNIRWRYPKSFPYRVIYEVDERERIVIVAAVLHAARHDREWKRRV